MEQPTAITADTIVARNDKKFITSTIGDEIVMMSMDSGNYIGMNTVGSVIWERLQQPSSVKDLVRYLLGIYNIDEAECTRKTMKYLNDMIAQGMLTMQA